MADITGTISGTTANAEIKSRILWEETADVAANAGSVTATLQLRTYTGYATYSHDSDFYLKINGTTYSAMSKYVELTPESGWTTCFEKTVSGIAHNADGTKAIGISGWGNMYGTSVSSITCGDTAILCAIPRASTFTLTSAVEVNGTNAVNVAITRASDAYTHRVDIYAGTSYDAATYRARFTGVATSKAYAIPASWRLCMPTTMAGKAKVTVATFSGDAQIGDPRTAEFTISVPASVKPAITTSNVTIAPAQPSAISTFAHYVQGYSAVKATFAGTASAFGSEVAIAETYIQYGSAKIVGNPAQTAVIAASGDITVTVGVKDARGQLTTATRTARIEEYSPPSMSGIDVFRCLLAGTASDAGTYASVKAKAIFSACGGDNALSSFRAQYKAATASAYGAWTSLASGVPKVIGGGALLVTQSYDVQLQIQDAVGNQAYWTGRIPTADVALNLKAGGRGVGFGKFAEAEELADFDYPIKAPDLQVATHNLKTYTSVSQLGFTLGAPTINQVFAVLPLHSMLRCESQEFANGQAPTAYGRIEMHKSTVIGSTLMFNGKTSRDGDYRQYLIGSGSEFDGVWQKVLDFPDRASALSEIGAAPADHAHSTFSSTQIPASANLNSYTAPGTYHCPSNADAATMTNCPATLAFSMIVVKHVGICQIFITYHSSGPRVFMRNYYGSWGVWEEGVGVTEATEPAVPSTLGTMDIFSLYKVGKVVTFLARYASTIPAGISTDAAIIPNAYHPVAEYIPLATYSTSAAYVVQAYASSAGTIRLRCEDAISNVLISGSWITP